MKAIVSDMKTVRRLHRARREDIGELVTYQALPVSSLGVEGLEPFLLLNHHGPQVYPPRNRGLPFGPHPHRGFETITFIIDGDLVHRDTGGYESRIGAGGEDIRFLDGLDTSVEDGDEVTILPAVAGG